MTCPSTVERGSRASAIGDAEGVFGEGAQDATGIVEEFESLVAGVGNGRGNLQVFQSIDLDVGDRRLDGQSGGSGDGERTGGESNEGSTEGRGEHREGGRGNGSSGGLG